ncbi:hypothetical protein EYC84_000986 [Monilinia fructicola]|uniref:Uncharacterized protein n=1 Tax=Monilinia fructicola TaxID=38448 RepID=A0A5M9JIQ6_MONFR|nr:hypothetical protein EYC84_000986 [Monilinia fructicola]
MYNIHPYTTSGYVHALDPYVEAPSPYRPVPDPETTDGRFRRERERDTDSRGPWNEKQNAHAQRWEERRREEPARFLRIAAFVRLKLDLDRED